MKVRNYKRCYAAFPCQDKHVQRVGETWNGESNHYKVVVCTSKDKCNQQHNNLSVEANLLRKMILKEIEI